MKNSLIAFSLFLSISIYSQETALDKIAKKTCEYLENNEIKQLESSKRVVKLGIYIINLYSEYEEELNAEGIVVDFSEGKEAGKVFGEKVGMNMINFCPEALIALSGDVDTDNDSVDVQTFIGKIMAIKGNDFSFIQVKNENGITNKFLWFSNFKGSEKLMSLDSITGISVKISYKNTECFSPKLNEYIIRKEIVEVEYLN